jgi:hypothetical protein
LTRSGLSDQGKSQRLSQNPRKKRRIYTEGETPRSKVYEARIPSPHCSILESDQPDSADAVSIVSNTSEISEHSSSQTNEILQNYETHISNLLKPKDSEMLLRPHDLDEGWTKELETSRYNGQKFKKKHIPRPTIKVGTLNLSSNTPIENIQECKGSKTASDASSAKPKELNELQSLISQLQEENKALELQVSGSQVPTWKILHQVHCERQGTQIIYSDPPMLYENGKLGHLQGQRAAGDFELFIARTKERISFVVYKHYVCCRRDSRYRNKNDIQTKRKSGRESTGPATTGEKIKIVSEEFAEALGDLSYLCDRVKDFYPCFDVGSILEAPYLWYYHNREDLKARVSELFDEQQTEFNLFLEYISQNFGDEYREVSLLLSKRTITARYFDYLYIPGLVLLDEHSYDTDGVIAFVQNCWSEISSSKFEIQEEQYYVSDYALRVSSWNWSFDGVFQKTEKVLECRFKRTPSKGRDAELDEEIEIKTLGIYPLKFADISVNDSLRERGEKFWSCRYRNYVEYRARDYRREEFNVG